jgi:hypothetical protein
MSDLTVIIPVHDPNEIYSSFINQALKSIEYQTLRPSQILLSGLGKPEYLDSVLESFALTLPLKFFMNECTSTSANLNFLARKSATKFTKILFQDDYLISATALEDISDAFNRDSRVWLASNSKNICGLSGDVTRTIRPHFSNRIRTGNNTIGSPSVIAFKTENFIDFDENLIWMLDCDWYLRMKHNFGSPIFLRDFQVANRLHDGQATHQARARHDLEVALTNMAHKRTRRLTTPFNFRSNCSCRLQKNGKF